MLINSMRYRRYSLADLKKAQEELVFENNQLNEQNNKNEQAFQELKENLLE